MQAELSIHLQSCWCKLSTLFCAFLTVPDLLLLWGKAFAYSFAFQICWSHLHILELAVFRRLMLMWAFLATRTRMKSMKRSLVRTGQAKSRIWIIWYNDLNLTFMYICFGRSFKEKIPKKTPLGNRWHSSLPGSHWQWLGGFSWTRGSNELSEGELPQLKGWNINIFVLGSFDRAFTSKSDRKWRAGQCRLHDSRTGREGILVPLVHAMVLISF